MRNVEGKIWRRVIAKGELPLLQNDHAVISTRLVAGKTVVHVFSEEQPAGFEPCIRQPRRRLLLDAAHRGGRVDVAGHRAASSSSTTSSRRSSTILFVILFALTFAAVTGDRRRRSAARRRTSTRNAPYVIMHVPAGDELFGMLTTTAFVANSIHRDFELTPTRSSSARPISKVAVPGRPFPRLVPRRDADLCRRLPGHRSSAASRRGSPKEHLGPFELCPYLYSIAILVLPNLLLAGAIFFAVAALTRSLMATYASIVGTVVLYGVANSLAEDIENADVGGDARPVRRARRSMIATRYWTRVREEHPGHSARRGLSLEPRALGGRGPAVSRSRTGDSASPPARARTRQEDARRANRSTQTPARVAVPLPRVRQTFGSASLRNSQPS